MTLKAQIPVQYEKLFHLLSLYSNKYYSETEKVFARFGKFGYTWNPHHCKFEIDVYFLSLLSFSIVGFKQDKDVGVELQLYFSERFIQCFGGKISAETTFDDIIGSRVNSYCQLKHDCIKDSKNRNIEMEMLQELLLNIDASNSSDEIKAGNPIVSRDFFDQRELESCMFPVHFRESIEFCSCLKELFEATQDIRTLSCEEIDNRIDRGKKNTKQIISKIDLSQISDSLSARNLIRKMLEEGIVSQADLLRMSSSKLIRTILEKEKKSK